MNMPPQRIALVALLFLTLLGGGVWWWWHRAIEPARQQGASASSVPMASAKASPVVGGDVPVAMPMGEAIRRCGSAIRDAFNVRALELRDVQEGPSQLAYALAVPVASSLNAKTMPEDAQASLIQRRETETQQAMLNAAALAGGNSDVLWITSQRCIGGPDCETARKALLQVEPGNMLVWLREMEWARQRHDPAAMALAFERAASAPVYNAHVGVIPEMVGKAYGNVPLPRACLDEGVQQAMQREMRIELGRPYGVVDHAMLLATVHAPMSLLGALRTHCKPDSEMESARGLACRRVLVRLAEGDIWIERMIALDILVQLLGDDPEAAPWRERYRQNHWITAQGADSSIQALLQPEDYWNDPGRATQAALQIAGRWPPPADWLPESERARSLILTGRPPAEKKGK